MINIISFSYPPDNVPAAHRPYELAVYLERIGVPVVVHSRFGQHSAEQVPSAQGFEHVSRSNKSGRLKQELLSRVNNILGWALQVDKALPWALRALPRTCFTLLKERVKTRKRPVIWATCPLPSNLYLACCVAWIVRADLHLDLRDAIEGINSKRAPWMTRTALSMAKSISAVTETLARYVDDTGFGPPAEVVFNGVSDESLSHSSAEVMGSSGWIQVSYTGAVYGGDRPYIAAIRALADVARMLPKEVPGIQLTIAGREDLSLLPKKYSNDRFVIILSGEVSKRAALAMAAASEINMILVGSKLQHRCAIPLKAFDLLGVGRPFLYLGPVESDAMRFIRQYASASYFSINSENLSETNLAALCSWLLTVRCEPSSPQSEPSTRSQSAKIARLLGVQ